ncbi:MAG: patatin-like phospholipase family protein [Actinobacteria bacterium]|nr:patatin-like phospholipase family protein [Actinomycetota bacterium]
MSDDTDAPASTTWTTGLRLVNGVFKGGGAKGVAYTGALRAFRDRGFWFGSVAGASAGALTAAMIAAGMDPDEMERDVPAAVRATQASTVRAVGNAVLGRTTSLYDTKGMRDWLERKLAQQVGVTDGRPVTFEQLHRHSGIELYVVAMDLANGLPIVFSRRSTPSVDVAGAVAASCAIPGAFPAGRGVWYDAEVGATVHQLVDGGVWANYPGFVFKDRSFRLWLRAASEARDRWSGTEDRAWDVECDRPVVGFVIGEPVRLETREVVGMVPMAGERISSRYDRGPASTSPQPGLHAFGAVLSNDLARLVVLASTAALIVLGLVHGSIMIRRTAANLDNWLPSVVFPFALVGLLSLAFTAAVASLAVVVSLIVSGRLIADTLLPSIRSLIAVPTGVPAWVGLGDDGVVIIVPAGRLTTIDFAVDDDVRREALEAAYRSTHDQLCDERNRAILDALLAGERPEVPLPVLQVSSPVASLDVRRGAWRRAIAVVLATAAIGLLAWWAVDKGSTDRVRTLTGTILAGLVVGGVAVWYLGSSSAARAANRTGIGVHPRQPVSDRLAGVFIVAGAALLSAAFITAAVAMERRDESVERGRVEAASAGAGDVSTYEISLDRSGDRVTLETERHLRMHEHVYVRRGDGSQLRLSGPLPGWTFPLAIVLSMSGVGLLTSGLHRRRWNVRTRHLAQLVAHWERAEPASGRGRRRSPVEPSGATRRREARASRSRRVRRALRR